MYFKPLNILKPIVHCPTFCYYTKVRTGKGFLQELKVNGLNERYIRTIKIIIDSIEDDARNP